MLTMTPFDFMQMIALQLQEELRSEDEMQTVADLRIGDHFSFDPPDLKKKVRQYELFNVSANSDYSRRNLHVTPDKPAKKNAQGRIIEIYRPGTMLSVPDAAPIYIY